MLDIAALRAKDCSKTITLRGQEVTVRPLSMKAREAVRAIIPPPAAKALVPDGNGGWKPNEDDPAQKAAHSRYIARLAAADLLVASGHSIGHDLIDKAEQLLDVLTPGELDQAWDALQTAGTVNALPN